MYICGEWKDLSLGNTELVSKKIEVLPLHKADILDSEDLRAGGPVLVCMHILVMQVLVCAHKRAEEDPFTRPLLECNTKIRGATPHVD
jgi:hypothetical protein